MKGIIDRFEGGIAVIQLEGGGDVLLPASRIPPGGREGNVIEFVIRLDEKAAAERKETIGKRKEKLW